mmetsp:Transcript_7554/g.11527  ORF Transcript_7554/g.11527 Transcript_7554/m.11527 type:complete len:430 (+) Transcript_7554:83-1372(+)
MNLNPVQSLLILGSSCSNGTFSQSLHSHPLWCNLSIIPEIGSTNDAILRVDQLDLNPCGFENVLLLEKLMPGKVYLMSLFDCYTAMNKIDIPVISSPSAFFFSLEERPLVKEGKLSFHHRKNIVELEVMFDISDAFVHLISVQRETEQRNPLLSNESISLVENEYQHKVEVEAGNNPRTHNAHKRFNEILKLLEKNAERDSRDIDLILCVTLCVFLALLVLYLLILTSAFKSVLTEDINHQQKSAILRDTPSTIQEFPEKIEYDCHKSKKNDTASLHQIIFREHNRHIEALPEKSNTKPVRKFLPVAEARAFEHDAQTTTLPNTLLQQRSKSIKKTCAGLQCVIPQAKSTALFKRKKKNARDISPRSQLRKSGEEKRRSKRRIVPSDEHETVAAEAASKRKLLVPIENEMSSDVPTNPQCDGYFLNEYW